MEVLEVGLQRQPALLAELLRDRPDQVAHRDRAPLVGGLERGRQRAVADRAAGELELGREELEVDVGVERRLLGQQQPPDQLAVLGLGEREVDHEVEPAHERVVDVLAEVGREDHGARIALHLLQQVGDLDVGVAVVRVRDLGALAEQRVGLVEEEDRVGAGGGLEDAVEVLLGLPDVLGDDGGEVDAEELEPELGAEHLGGHRLAGARLAREQHLEPLGARDGALVAPLGEHAVAVAQVGRDRAEHLALAVGQHEVRPAVARGQLGGELAEQRGGGVAGAAVEVGGLGRVAVARARGDAWRPRRPAAIWVSESRNFALTSRVSRGAGQLGPRGLALGEVRHRHLDQQHGAVAERERAGSAWARAGRAAPDARRARAAAPCARRARGARARRRTAAGPRARSTARRRPSPRAWRGRARRSAAAAGRRRAPRAPRRRARRRRAGAASGRRGSRRSRPSTRRGPGSRPAPPRAAGARR